MTRTRRRGGDAPPGLSSEQLLKASKKLKPVSPPPPMPTRSRSESPVLNETIATLRPVPRRATAGRKRTRRRKVRRGGAPIPATKSEALDEIERIIQTPMLVENLKESDELSKDDPEAYFKEIERYKEQIRAFSALEKVTTQNGPFIQRNLAPIYPEVDIGLENVMDAAEIFQGHREGGNDPPVFAGSFLRLISALREAIANERAKLT